LKTFRNLSLELSELLAEAQCLLNLKSELGRLPNSRFKTVMLERIEFWFRTEGGDPSEPLTVGGKGQTDPSTTDTERSVKGPGFLSKVANEVVRAEELVGSTENRVPDDDDIPF